MDAGYNDHMISALLLVIGLAVLVVGGDSLVRGASALALRLRIAPVIIGMTIVAFGTSTPELVVNMAAALRGDSSIGFGNVIGSNIANIGLLLAVTVLAYPLIIHRSIVSREIPMLLLASLAVVVLGLNSITEGDPDRFTRGDGIMLLLLFCVFLYYTLSDALQQRESNEAISSDEFIASKPDDSSSWLMALRIIGGLLLLVVGGALTVRGGVGVASSLGVSEVIIGLTVIAVGTSLPELATTISAARRGSHDMAVGNIVGSNIFNLLFIWGLSITITPTVLPAGGRVDLLVMTAYSAVLLPMAITRRKISRPEGSVLLLGYIVYILWLALR